VNYLSVCSGIEAATCAWHPLGWNPIGFSEIEPFPCKVLAHHYPSVPNLGDMTKFKEWPDATINVLVGGTPCQSFSVAGLRKGLDDPRGNLMLIYLAIADRYKPKWIVWENVPGVLSSNGGRDFGTFLGGLGQLGYGFAYRVLDAQFSRTHEHPRAVPQRRRRVFVIGCLGDWRSAAAVLFDSESLCGNPPPSRSKGQEFAGTIGARTGVSIGAQDAACGHILPVKKWPAEIASTLNAHFGDKQGLENQHINEGAPLFVPTYALAGNTIGRAPENGGNGTGYDDTGSSYTLTKTDVHAVAYEEHTGTIRKEPGDNQMAVCSQMRVRRLTPLECERLQGFPEVTKTVILRVCSDHQKTNALAETQCPKLPNVAGNAVVSESQKIASFAEVNSRQSNHKTSELAEVSALLNLEARTLEIHNQGKLLLSVNLADKQKWCRLPIQLDDFVQLNVRLHTLLGTNTIVGGAALPQNINNSSHHGYGSKSVDVSGQEIEQLVSDATKFMSTKNDCMKFITSEVGSNFQSYEQSIQTLCCFVVSVISSFIPEQMHNGNSYAINLSLTHGYTNIPGASNSARYKALGNSMAVNCMRILGERIAMMETIDVISDLL
jgi:DNA (cytosine-5)-methyltransferase 1